MRNKLIKYSVIGAFFVCAGITYLSGFCGENFAKQGLVIDMEEASTSEVYGDAIDETTETQTEVFYVYVCGAVMTPGVYPVSEGARMYEAIELAGGKNPEGCLDYMELAQILQDGSRIYVPTRQEVEDEPLQFKNAMGEAGMVNSGNGKVNINTASKELLMTLPGIGESKATAIIKYRNENGKFATIEDIMKIAGIKEAAFSKIKDYICA